MPWLLPEISVCRMVAARENGEVGSEFADLISPGNIGFNRGGWGQLGFGAVEGSLHWKPDAADKRVKYSLEGFDGG